MKTIREAIEYVDAVKPNDYKESIKKGWLSELDKLIFSEVIVTHENGIDEFNGYDEDTPLDTQLLVSSPYDEFIYSHYLEMKIDYYNAEYGKYNNSASMFNNAYEAFKVWYERNNKPLPRKQVINFREV